MIRGLAWLMAASFLGGLVHFATVFALPILAERDAYARLTTLAPVNRLVLLPQAAAGTPLLPFLDPAFATAVCRYDLSSGPLRLHVPLTRDYTSVAFYSRHGVVSYSINDRAAGRRTIDLIFMTARQRAQMQEDEEVTAADRLIVDASTVTGLIAVRGLAAEPGMMPVVRGILATARCEVGPAPDRPQPGAAGQNQPEPAAGPPG